MTRANIEMTLNGQKIYGVIESSAYPTEIKPLLDKIKFVSELEELKQSDFFKWINEDTFSLNKVKETRTNATYKYVLNFDTHVFHIYDYEYNYTTNKEKVYNRKSLLN